ncbi:MAG: ribosomal protein L16, partial [Patescibacteria group bacterium]|nr:ribosomal protein L16 [Patescibacteria group bacterium]
MLAPKRQKFRKTFRGKNRGQAVRGSKINFGEYGLKAMVHGHE